MNDSNPLVGTWKLHSFQIIEGDIVRDALGPSPVGYLIYTADGYMSAQIMSSRRELISQLDLKKASSEEKAKLVDTYRSYAGTYRIEGNKVIHQVQVGLVSNWVGTEMIRTFEHDGKRLTLQGPTGVVNSRQVAVLVWEKI